MAEKRAGDQAPRIGWIVTAVRVTAIEAAIVDRLERSFVEGARTIAKLVMRTPALLEALDTIDKAKALHLPVGLITHNCGVCITSWPCPTWQALNGGNESGDDG